MIAVQKSQRGSAVIRWNTKATITRLFKSVSSAGLRKTYDTYPTLAHQVSEVSIKPTYVMNYSRAMSNSQEQQSSTWSMGCSIITKPYNYGAMPKWMEEPQHSDLTALVSPFGGLDSAGKNKSTSIGGNNVTGFNGKAEAIGMNRFRP